MKCANCGQREIVDTHLSQWCPACMETLKPPPRVPEPCGPCWQCGGRGRLLVVADGLIQLPCGHCGGTGLSVEEK